MTPLQRCAELLRNGDALSHAQAVEIAQNCVTKEPARAEAYVWLTRALLRARRASQAVIWAKKGTSVLCTRENDTQLQVTTRLCMHCR